MTSPSFVIRLGMLVLLVVLLLGMAQGGDHPITFVDAQEGTTTSEDQLGLFSDEEVRCTVCLRAVEHMWHRGVMMRDECEHPDRELQHDYQCYLGNILHEPVMDLVNGTCDAITDHYQGGRHEEHKHFVMHLHGSPTHSDEEAAVIKAACTRWIYDTHTVELVARVIFSNLDARKTTEEILYPIQKRFCREPCNIKKPKHTRKMPPPHHVEKHDDFSEWAKDPNAYHYNQDVNLEHHREDVAEHAKTIYHDDEGDL